MIDSNWERAEKARQALYEKAGRLRMDHLEPPSDSDVWLGTVLGSVRQPTAEGIHLYEGWLGISRERMREHVLVVGRSGSGKTSLLLRQIEQHLFNPEVDTDLCIIDGKGDPKFARQIAKMAHLAGKGPVPIVKVGWKQRSPSAVFKPFVGDNYQVFNQLIALLDLESWGSEGDHHRTNRRRVLQLICGINVDLAYGIPAFEPPRSYEQIVGRLSDTWLAGVYGGTDVASELKDLHPYVPSLRTQIGEALLPFFNVIGENGVTFGDSRVLVISIATTAGSWSAKGLFRMVTAGLVIHMLDREGIGRPLQVFIDEFSDLGGGLTYQVVNQGRSMGVGVLLSTLGQTGLGSDPQHREAIFDSTGTKIYLGHDNIDRFLELAGSEKVPDSRISTKEGLPDTISTGRREELIVSPLEVRRLRKGQCFVVGGGYKTKIHVKQVEPEYTDLSDYDEQKMEDIRFWETKLKRPTLKKSEEPKEPPSKKPPLSDEEIPL